MRASGAASLYGAAPLLIVAAVFVRRLDPDSAARRHLAEKDLDLGVDAPQVGYGAPFHRVKNRLAGDGGQNAAVVTTFVMMSDREALARAACGGTRPTERLPRANGAVFVRSGNFTFQ